MAMLLFHLLPAVTCALAAAVQPTSTGKTARLLVPRVNEAASISYTLDFFNTTLATALHASWSATTNSTEGDPKKKWWRAFQKDDDEEEEDEEDDGKKSKFESWRYHRKKAAKRNLARRQAARRLREARKGQADLDNHISNDEREALERWSDGMDGKKVKRAPAKRAPKPSKVDTVHSTKSLRGFGGGGGAGGKHALEEREPARTVHGDDSAWGISTSSKSTSTTEAPAQESNSSWSDWSLPITVPGGPSTPRVHFLFLVGDDIPHSEQWRAFFANGKESEWAAFAHCKSGCSSSLRGNIPGLQEVDTVDTYYCHDLVTAMVQLLRFASRDGGHENDKFVFLSDSTLPVKPFAEVYAALNEHEESDFCIFPSDHWAEADFNNQRAYLVKHQQWVVLNRVHAELMVRNWGSVDSNGHWAVPIRNEVDYSPEAVYNASHFSRSPTANWCTDEWAFFATIFGAQLDDGSVTKAISGFAGRHGSQLVMRGPKVAKMQGTCRTFAFFSETDKDMTQLAKSLAQDFPHTYLSCWPICHAHPTRIERLSAGGLLEMRQSPFLFVRKFHSKLDLPRFKEIILAPYPPDDITPAAAHPSPPSDPDVSHHDWDLIDDANNATYSYSHYS